MPKRTPRKIIDTRTRNSAKTISGITLSTPASVSDHGLLLGLGDDDHSQYLLASGGRTLTGNLAASAGVTIDGIDISAHAANPDAHHATATAGNSAISVAGQAISLAAAAAGAGLSYAAGVLAVGAGSGLTVNADDVALTTPGALSVATSSSAAGNHTHAITSSSNPGAAASILASDASGYVSLVRLSLSDRVRTPLIDTTSGPLTLQPANNVVSLPPAVSIQTNNYDSQLTGWRATYAGEGDFRYLFVDEMHAKSFIADLEQALAGGQIISKSVAVLAGTFTAPAAGAPADLYVRDLPSAPDMAVFQDGDAIRLRQFSRAGGSLSIADCWGVVYSYSDGNGINFPDGWQHWDFYRSAAPNAGTMAAGTVIQPDSIVLDYGTSGNGYYEVNAIDGLYGANSPYSRIVTWSGHPATGQSLRVQMGNLRGVYGYASAEYGIAMGDPVTANITVDATNGVRLRQGTTDKIVLNPAGDSYFAGVMTIGTAGEIRQGTGTLGSNFTGLRIWRESNVGRISGYNNNVAQWWGATDGKLYGASGALWIDTAGLNLTPYASVFADNSTNILWPNAYHNPLRIYAYAGSGSNSCGVVVEVPSSGFSTLGALIVKRKDYPSPGISAMYAVWHEGNDAPLAKLSGASFSGDLYKTVTESGLTSGRRIGLVTSGALATATDNDGMYLWHVADNEMAIGVGDDYAWRTLVLQPYGGTVDVRAYLLASSVGYDWSSLTPGGGWNNFGSGNATFGVKRFGNLVSIKGVLSASGTIASDTSIYTLASEYRPATIRQFICYGSPGAVRVLIASDGTIRPQAAFSSGNYLSVEITYFTGG